MIWKKDKLRPTQPYFVFDTEDFFQEVYLRQGISHFYSYHVEEAKEIRVVPDGCIDIICEVDNDRVYSYVHGTILGTRIHHHKDNKIYFGMRFFPGVLPPTLIKNSLQWIT